jgi:hypothetical protein
MAEAPIPFGNVQESGQEELAGASPFAINVITDGKGAVMQRPGVGPYAGAPATPIGLPVDMIYATVGGVLLVVAGSAPSRNIYSVTAGGAGNLSSVLSGDLTGPARPVIAEAEALVVLTAGSLPQKVTLPGLVSARLGGVPPNGFSVVANSSRLLIDNPTFSGQVQFSDVFTGTVTYAGAETWIPAVGNSAGFFNAAARPDPVQAIRDNTNEIFVFGTSTLQIFDPDPTVTYAPAATREVGCSAAQSVVKVDQSFMWLDDKRRFVVSDGRTFQVLSDAIQQTLNDLSVVGDCFGYRFVEGSADALVWTFPTDGRTFVYQVGKGWGEWLGWNDSQNISAPFGVTAHHLRADQDVNVVSVGLGQIAKLSRNFSTDLGARFQASVTTGFSDQGSGLRKQCVSVRLFLRRGQTGENQGGRLWWRDTLGTWEGGLRFTLGATGDYESMVEFRSLGVYRKRQWKFEFSGTDPFVLASAAEEFSVLGN